MKEHPTLFNGPMVCATLDDRKTITRRPIKLGELITCCDNPSRDYVPHSGEEAVFGGDDHISYIRVSCCDSCDDGGTRIFPQWHPGDELWVRETWGVRAYADDAPAIAASVSPGARNKLKFYLEFRADEKSGSHYYWGDVGYDRIAALVKCYNDECRWRPSIHMPRWASRIQLVVKSVRAERLHEITPGDIELEGISVPEIPLPDWLAMNMDEQWQVYTNPFFELWDKMYAKKPELLSDANPWVWRIEFERKQRS